MFVPTTSIMLVVSELSRRGFARSVVLEAAGLAQQAEGSLLLPLDSFDRLADLTADLLGDPAGGLVLGSTAPLTGLGVVAHVVLASRTLREAIQAFQHYSGLLVRAFQCELDEKDDVAILRYGTACPGAASHFAAEFAAALSVRAIERFGNARERSLAEVWFTHAAPAHDDRYRAVFGCRIRFDRPSCAFVFKRALLDELQPHSEPHLRDLLRRAADYQLAHPVLHTTYADQVRAVLMREPELSVVGCDKLAAKFAMDQRTLRRHLRAEGTCMSKLFEEVRRARAQNELNHGSHVIREVATRLGYSEASAFHRAFKRWSGQTPAQYRRARGKAASMQLPDPFPSESAPTPNTCS